MSQYTVCKAGQLQVGDLFLDPMTGVLAKVTKVERFPRALSPVKIHMTLTVSHSLQSIELPDTRLMRRQWRPGERDAQGTSKSQR